MANKRKSKLVVVGGGTGTHTALRGLKRHQEILDITAIVTMADSGGSSGRLRDEFGQLPAGDVRNALTALAADGDEYDLLLRSLFEYRFDRGEGLSGHNFGNLFLTALTAILGSEAAAIKSASHILRVAGRVVPVTLDRVDLVADYSDGTRLTTEHEIDTYVGRPGVRLRELRLSQSASLNPEAKQALMEADLVVIGPGDLYTSVLANCVVPDFAETLQTTASKVIYIANLMTKAGQTTGFGTREHLDEIIRYTGRVPETMVVNSTPLPPALIQQYAEEEAYPLHHNYFGSDCQVRAVPLLSSTIHEPIAGDALKRSLVRHDPELLAAAILSELGNVSEASPRISSPSLG